MAIEKYTKLQTFQFYQYEEDCREFVIDITLHVRVRV